MVQLGTFVTNTILKTKLLKGVGGHLHLSPTSIFGMPWAAINANRQSILPLVKQSLFIEHFELSIIYMNTFKCLRRVYPMVWYICYWTPRQLLALSTMRSEVLNVSVKTRPSEETMCCRLHSRRVNMYRVQLF